VQGLGVTRKWPPGGIFGSRHAGTFAPAGLAAGGRGWYQNPAGTGQVSQKAWAAGTRGSGEQAVTLIAPAAALAVAGRAEG